MLKRWRNIYKTRSEETQGMRDLRAIIADDRQRLEQEVRELRAIVADDRQRLSRILRDLRAIVADDRQRLMQLQRYSNPFAISQPIEESPAHPSQFVDADYQRLQVAV